MKAPFFYSYLAPHCWALTGSGCRTCSWLVLSYCGHHLRWIRLGEVGLARLELGSGSDQPCFGVLIGNNAPVPTLPTHALIPGCLLYCLGDLSSPLKP